MGLDIKSWYEPDGKPFHVLLEEAGEIPEYKLKWSNYQAPIRTMEHDDGHILCWEWEYDENDERSLHFWFEHPKSCTKNAIRTMDPKTKHWTVLDYYNCCALDCEMQNVGSDFIFQSFEEVEKPWERTKKVMGAIRIKYEITAGWSESTPYAPAEYDYELFVEEVV